MIEQAFVHIGMNKTGSSSIQRTFSSLTMDGCEYLNLGSPNHSEVMVTVFSSQPGRYHAHVRNARSDLEVSNLRKRWCRRLEEALEGCTSKDIILSGEGMSGGHLFSSEDIGGIKALLERYCKNINIIGYVRPPVSFMQSAFQERVKAGEGRKWNVDSFYPFYRARFEKFDQIFGSNAVHLIPFKTEALYKGDVVRDFGKRIGVEVPVEQIIRSNESLSLEATALLYTARQFGPGGRYAGFSRDAKKRVAALSGFGSGKLIFAASLVAPVLEAHRADIEWMNQRLGQSIEDWPQESDRAITSEEDLLAIACEQKDEVWQLIEKVSGPLNGLSTVVELVDRVHSLISRCGQVTKPSDPIGWMSELQSADLADERLSASELLLLASGALSAGDPAVAATLRASARRAAGGSGGGDAG